MAYAKPAENAKTYNEILINIDIDQYRELGNI